MPRRPKSITLSSAEGQEFKIPFKVAIISLTIKELYENMGLSEYHEVGTIPLPAVKTKVLEQVIKWMKKHVNTMQPTNEEIRNRTDKKVDPWNKKFLKMGLQELYDLTAAASYMNIPGLVWLTTREVAYMIKGKSAEQIRLFFNIDYDMTSNQLQAIFDENHFVEN